MDDFVRYPFVPEEFYGYVFERDSHRYRIGWPHVSRVVPLTANAPAIFADVGTALGGATKDNRASAVDFVHQMEEVGYAFLGVSSFDFRSGTLFWQAHMLIRLAHASEERRQSILARRGGHEPTEGNDDWPDWFTTSLRAGACATGARLLGYASLEAFVNEVFYVNFRDVYDAYETRSGPQRTTPFASMPDKLSRLLKELKLPTDQEWLRRIRNDAPIRRGIEHHKLSTAFTEPIGDEGLLDYSDGASPDDVQEFLDAVQTAFHDVHAAFGVSVPPTHLPPS